MKSILLLPIYHRIFNISFSNETETVRENVLLTLGSNIRFTVTVTIHSLESTKLARILHIDNIFNNSIFQFNINIYRQHSMESQSLNIDDHKQLIIDSVKRPNSHFAKNFIKK